MCPVLVLFNVVSPSPKKESLNKQPIMNGKRANESVVFPTLCELQCLGESTSYLVFFLVSNTSVLPKDCLPVTLKNSCMGDLLGGGSPAPCAHVYPCVINKHKWNINICLCKCMTPCLCPFVPTVMCVCVFNSMKGHSISISPEK